MTIRLDYGTLQIDSYERTEGGGWIRRETYRPDNPQRYLGGRVEDSIKEHSFCTSKEDTSTRWKIYPNYNSKCGGCYLNFTHTADYHNREIARAK